MNYNKQHNVWVEESGIIAREKKLLANKMRSDGFNARQIAVGLGVSKSRVYQYLKKK